MGEIEELKQDAEEARMLLASATRNKWKDLLSAELHKIEIKLNHLQAAAASESSEKSTLAKNVPVAKLYTITIRNYSWDQSDKFVKIYITLNGVQNINKENITCDFGKNNIELKITHLQDKNYELIISNLAYPIDVEKCYHKVKDDMLVIFASKTTTKSWEAITAEEKRILDAKKVSKKKGADKEDPSVGLMGLMKQMYEDGDDEMKRMINKTWYESQGKNHSHGGIPEIGSLDL